MRSRAKSVRRRPASARRSRPPSLRLAPQRHAHLVARRIAETRVDAVRLLRRLLLELYPAALQLLIRPLDVVGGEEGPLATPLATSVLIASCVSASKTGGPGMAMSVIATSGWPGTPTLSQRKFPISGTVTSSRSSSPSSVVELERLVLIVDPDLRVGELLQHRVLLCRLLGGHASEARLGCLLQTCCVRTSPCHQDAGRDARVCQRGRMRRAIRRGRHAERPAEARRKGTHAPQADGKADVRDRAIRRAKQRCGALEPSVQEVLVWRLSPNVRRNSRLKCAGESLAVWASALTSRRSR